MTKLRLTTKIAALFGLLLTITLAKQTNIYPVYAQEEYPWPPGSTVWAERVYGVIGAETECNDSCEDACTRSVTSSGPVWWCPPESIIEVEEVEEESCEFSVLAAKAWTKCTFESIKEDVANALDIRRTVMDMTATLATDAPMYITTGKGVDQATGCMCKADPVCVSTASDDIKEIMATLTTADCKTFNDNPLAVAAGVEAPPPYGGHSGSIAGIVMKGTTIAYTEPVPVSLAYYARDLASNVPFLENTAYAQSIQTGSFPGFAAILKLWKLVRNFSFGIVAIFMVVTGIMIMMRKQINPRTAVTVQNALPRLVIALALIAFSYAIGALFIALIRPLISVALEPVRLAAEDNMTHGPILTFFWLMMGSSGGSLVTFVTLLLYIVAGVVLIIVFAMAIFKLLVSYVEALALVVIAPLQFAWGSIPGNEDSIMNWFKAMAVAVLSIPAVTAGLSFGLYFAWTYMKDTSIASAQAGVVGPLASGWFSAGVGGWTSLLVPIMVAGIFIFSSQIPAKLKETIMDKK